MKIFLNLAAAAVFGLTSYRVKWLSGSGSIAASLFGFCLLTWGGVAWIVPVLIFFGTSSLLSKIRRRTADSNAGATPVVHEGKSEDVRNATQVLANGGVAWIMLAGYVLGDGLAVPRSLWFVGFVGALAAATADTWGTEIGRLSAGRAISVLTGRPVLAGTSGGISWQGTLGGVAGALLIASVGRMSFPEAFTGWSSIVMITAAGGFASLVDSLLGATLQVRYRDPVTNEITERLVHPDMQPHTGWGWMTNDTVNFVCTLCGAGIAMLMFALTFSTLSP